MFDTEQNMGRTKSIFVEQVRSPVPRALQFNSSKAARYE
jgi:hypothetical protein